MISDFIEFNTQKFSHLYSELLTAAANWETLNIFIKTYVYFQLSLNVRTGKRNKSVGKYM